MTGSTMNGVTTKSIRVSFQLTSIIQPSAKIEVTIERIAIEKVDPKNVSSSVTSAVSRETASPVLSLAK